MSAERISGSSRLPDEDRILVKLAESFTRTGMDATGILDLLAAWVETEFPDGDYSDQESSRFRSKLQEHRVDPGRIDQLVREPERFPHREEVGKHYSAETVERMRAVRATVGRLLTGTSAARTGPIMGSTHKAPQGSTSSSVRRRLNRDRPDLAEQVATGEMSANAAAIEAGYRRRKVSYAPDDPVSVVKSLRTHMEPDALVELMQLLAAALQDLLETNRNTTDPTH